MGLLLRNEFQAFRKFYLYLAGASLLVAVLRGILELLGLGGIFPFEAFVMTGYVGMVFGVAIYHSVAYWQSVHGKYSPLTHSIPVRGSQIFWAKALLMILGVVATALWLFVLVRILAAMGTLSGSAPIQETMAQPWMTLVDTVTTMNLPGLVWTLIMALILLLTPLLVVAGMTIGSTTSIMGETRNQPLIGSVIAFVAAQAMGIVGAKVLPVGIVFNAGNAQRLIFGDFEPPVMPVGESTAIYVTYIGGHIAYLVMILILCWWAARSLERHLHVSA